MFVPEMFLDTNCNEILEKKILFSMKRKINKVLL